MTEKFSPRYSTDSVMAVMLLLIWLKAMVTYSSWVLAKSEFDSLVVPIQADLADRS